MSSPFWKDGQRILALWFPHLSAERVLRQRLGRSWRSGPRKSRPPLVFSHRENNTQRIAALDELTAFELRYVKAVYGESILGDVQQMAGVMAMYPAFAGMASRMQEEGHKLDGTSLSTTMTFEAVKSEEQMKAAAGSQQDSGGGGIGGMLGRRIMGNRGEPQARTKVLTTTHEMLSVDTTVTDADVAIPANLKLKD